MYSQFDVRPLLFNSCTSAVHHQLLPCFSSQVLLFCLINTFVPPLAIFKQLTSPFRKGEVHCFKFLHSSSACHLRTLRRSQDALFKKRYFVRLRGTKEG